jgi:glycosyltransferase involved in cell wall biosynthesis
LIGGVLIVSPNASSKFGGESFLPLKYFQILKKRGTHVVLVTHERNQADLEEYLGTAADQNILYLPETSLHRAIWSLGQKLPGEIGSVLAGNVMTLLDHFFQSRLIRRAIVDGRIALIHQPTPVSPLSPTGLHRFGLPLVVGPLNGGMTYPAGYEKLDRHHGIVLAARWFAKVIANRLVSGKRHAAAVLVANERTRRALPTNHESVFLLVENGVDFETWKLDVADRPTRDPGKLALVFLGRLVAWKAVDLTLAALAEAASRGIEVRLAILGDGPERRRLEELSVALGVSDRVTFHGFIPQKACAAHLADADALILNSVWECGGAVVLEAMAMGLPVIASDWGGPADYLDQSCGILVSPMPKTTFPSRLADAIADLAANPSKREEMGEAAQRKAREKFDWEVKVDRVQEVYAFALGGPRPTF